MALKVKAVERLLKFDKESAGKYRSSSFQVQNEPQKKKRCWMASHV